MTKNMIVTGGSRGIGAATARLAGGRGYSVVVNYNSNQAAADAVVDEIQSAGGQAAAVAGDVGAAGDVVALFDAAEAAFGPVGALINNAGIIGRQSAFVDMSVDRLERIVRTNVIGSMLCAQEAVRRMSTERGGAGGVIVNLSSVAARLGSPGEFIDYATTKGAIESFTRGLALETAQQGIRVNAVQPGLIYTDIHASGGEPDRVDNLKHLVPMGRGGTAEEVAEAILWLASDQSSYTTGAFVDVAGGR